MVFNNKFNQDNTIHFDVEEWSCTDPDTMQFCRKVDNTTFEYIQLRVEKLCQFVTIFHLNNKHLLEVLNDKTHINDWYQDEIDVLEYDENDVREYVAPYGGEDFLKGSKGDNRTQLICECIFEQNIMNCEYE